MEARWQALRRNGVGRGFGGCRGVGGRLRAAAPNRRDPHYWGAVRPHHPDGHLVQAVAESETLVSWLKLGTTVKCCSSVKKVNGGSPRAKSGSWGSVGWARRLLRVLRTWVSAGSCSSTATTSPRATST